MANGQPFDPDLFTAASWFFPLGTRLSVTTAGKGVPESPRCVLVIVTDRGPAKRLVRGGRIIDLSKAAFERLAYPELGLIKVKVTSAM